MNCITAPSTGIWLAPNIHIANCISGPLHYLRPLVPSCPWKGGRGVTRRHRIHRRVSSPLRCTIRDLHWLAVVVALAVGWWVDHRRHSPFDYFENWQVNGTTVITIRDTGERFILHEGEHATSASPMRRQ